MIDFVNGRLIEKYPTYAIIEANGIGYHINISLNTATKIGESEACKLFTHLAIREDAHTLYGFADKEERQLFRHLISVSGVGAATAQMILSSMSPTDVHQSIVNNDVASLQNVKGIGAKSAQRIIVDLKDKLTKEGMISDSGEVIAQPRGSVKDEALAALVTLGFTRNTANKALDKVMQQAENDLSIEDAIKATLKQL